MYDVLCWEAVSLPLGVSLADRTGTTASLKIIEGLCFESEFDTERLLRLLNTRGLGQMGCDYRGILVENHAPE